MNTFQQDLVKDRAFEFVEFQVGESNFALSISHVREIIQPIPVTVLPHAHPYIEGIIQLRGEVLPVLNLRKVIGYEGVAEENESKYIVAEFGDMTVVLDVTAVVHIQRIDQSEIEEATDMFAGDKVQVTGVIKRKNGMVLLVDFKKVITEQLL